MGKFNSRMDEAVYSISLNGFGETIGSSDMGSLTWIDLPFDLHDLHDHFSYLHNPGLTIAEIKELSKYRYALIYESTDGFVTVHYYTSDQYPSARQVWESHMSWMLS